MQVITKQKKYTPYIKGKHDTLPGLLPLHLEIKDGDLHNKLFQIDENIKKYLNNKKLCREDDISKYYKVKNEDSKTVKDVIKFAINTLLEEYPEYFKLKKDKDIFEFTSNLTNETIIFDNDYNIIEKNTYINLFHAIFSQIPEDIAICQIKEDKDYLSSIFVCSPSSWSPDEKIGMNFFEAHEFVPGMESYKKNYLPMVKGIINKCPFYRFVWELNTDNTLNHASKNNISISNPQWIEKPFDINNPKLYVRVERQSTVGFPENNAFIFLIRVFQYDIKELNFEELTGLENSIKSMSKETLIYKRLYPCEDILKYINFLKKAL